MMEEWTLSKHPERTYLADFTQQLEWESEFSSDAADNYSTFATFAPRYDPYAWQVSQNTSAFQMLEFLDLSTLHADSHHIVSGVFSGALYPSLRHLIVLERGICTEPGVSGDDIQILFRRSISL